MKVLVIKTSSMGDIIHTLPALTDASRHIPQLKFDWVIEEGFAEIPAWHASVDKIIPIAWRRWRKTLKQTYQQRELQQFYQRLRTTHYDYVIDAQSLLKSAIVSVFSHGLSCGLDFKSAREPLAALFYKHRFTVAKSLHAVTRVRELFAKSLNYTVTNTIPDYGIRVTENTVIPAETNYVVFIHGTTWTTKLWPQAYWRKLAEFIVAKGYRIYLPWSNAEEQQRAQDIANISPAICVLPKSSLTELAQVLAKAKAAVAVDTGLGHLAAALAVPTLSLYGPTNPKLVGTYGQSQIHLQAKNNDLQNLNAEIVWENLQPLFSYSR